MVSILIPVYNGSDFLKQAIESVLTQTYKDYEILVIDDGSTDGTAEIARSFVQVKYIYQPHSGVSVARNRGVRESYGDLIAFLDCDDIFDPTKIEKQVSYLEENMDCVICYSEISNFTELTELTERQSHIMNAVVEDILPSACIRRSVFSSCGYFDVNLPYGEDTEWVSRIRQMKAGRFYTVPEKLYRRRIHSVNLSLFHNFNGSETVKPILTKAVINARMMKHGRKVSVIIPAYNAEKYIEDALNSVYRQNWLGELEIIIVNNNSTDQTRAIAERHRCVILDEPRKGAAFARNKGIHAATGDYIFFLDADDLLADNACDILFRPMYGAREIQCVFASCVDFISPELEENEKAKIVPRQGPYAGSLPGCSLIRRDIVLRIGDFDTSLSSGETVDWLIRLKEAHVPMVTLTDVVLNRRIHLTNTGRIAAADERKNYAAILRRRMTRK